MFYRNMDKQRIMKFSAIGIGVVIAVLLIIIGFKLVSNVFTRASDEIPRDVTITDITQNSATLTWATGVANQGVVVYGTTPTALNFNAPETQSTSAHSVDLTLLSPTTTYYFQITIGGKNYDNGGVPWTFTTKATVTPTIILTPSPAPTIPAANPTPVQSLQLPGTAPATCDTTNCATIKTKLGQGCTTQDYFKCINKLTPTPTP